MIASKNPDAMTPAERDAEIASILARGVVRAVRIARSRFTRDIEQPQESPAEGLELPRHADLSVAARPRG
ncbi:MAG: hypothetical protein L6Q35_05520 [Phycisphaerales bacterium]|nr:hypothetical protein [Phycisphaerales bacterium]